MANKITAKERNYFILLGVAVILIIFGLMFMLTAAKLVEIFPAFYNIKHIILQYVIVIATMASGIMLFSNVSLLFEKDKLRNGLTLGITIFSTVLTLPLVYVFIACFPAMNGNIGPVGEIMVKDVALDFQSIFPARGAQIVIYILGTIMSIVFLAFPLVTGVLALKGKAIKIGKGGISIGTLPILEKSTAAEAD